MNPSEVKNGRKNHETISFGRAADGPCGAQSTLGVISEKVEG
jgi:hypothetical protein